MSLITSLRLLVALAAAAAVLWACDDSPAGPVDAGGDADSGDASGDADADLDGDTEPGCSACHGTEQSSAPPPDLEGSTSPSSPGVGAHGAHLGDLRDHAQVHCRHCHTVPESPTDPGHIDTERPADVLLSGLATFGGDASRNPDGTCTVYCHGSFLRVDPGASPDWTSADGPLDCEACHAMPPASPHPVATDCGRCHLAVSDLEGGIVQPSFHVDGVLQAPHHGHLPHLGGAGGTFTECTVCHIDDDYHGPLIDGGTLDDTTICADCHEPAEVTPEDWRTYEWP